MILAKFGKFFGLVILAVFITVSFLGFTHSFGMQMDAKGNMTGCMFSGTAICTMTPLEHFSAWQNMFTATTSRAADTLLALLLSAITFVTLLGLRRLFEDDHVFRSYQKFRSKRFSALLFADPLQEAFSNGILNSKRY